MLKCYGEDPDKINGQCSTNITQLQDKTNIQRLGNINVFTA